MVRKRCIWFLDRSFIIALAQGVRRNICGIGHLEDGCQLLRLQLGRQIIADDVLRNELYIFLALDLSIRVAELLMISANDRSSRTSLCLDFINGFAS